MNGKKIGGWLVRDGFAVVMGLLYHGVLPHSIQKCAVS